MNLHEEMALRIFESKYDIPLVKTGMKKYIVKELKIAGIEMDSQEIEIIKRQKRIPDSVAVVSIDKAKEIGITEDFLVYPSWDEYRRVVLYIEVERYVIIPDGVLKEYHSIGDGCEHDVCSVLVRICNWDYNVLFWRLNTLFPEEVLNEKVYEAMVIGRKVGDGD